MRSLRAALVAARVAASCIASAQVTAPQPPAAPPALPPRAPLDPRVRQRSYTVKDTNEVLPYAVFVSSKASQDRKAPLIIALHGYGGDQNTLMRGNAIQAAEHGGYILVGPMGYNASGWYGARSIPTRAYSRSRCRRASRS